jgi:hypothetical protein
VSDGEKERPNAKYNLSKPDNAPVPQEGLNFYYNRDHRLAKAPQYVQDLYKVKKTSRFGFLGVLIADKPRKILFFSIVLLCLMIWLLAFLGYFDSSYTLDGNKIKVSAAVVEGATILVINKTVKNKNKDPYTGAVDIAVSVPVPLQDDAQSQIEINFPVFSHRVFFTLEKEERYSFSVPFDSGELLLVLQTEKESQKIKLKVQF